MYENALEYVEYDVCDNLTNIPGTEAAFRDCGNPERSCPRKTTADHHIRFTNKPFFASHLHVDLITRPRGEERGDGEGWHKRSS